MHSSVEHEKSFITSGPDDDGKVASSANTQHVSKVVNVWFNLEEHSVHIYLCERSIVNCLSLITASWTNIVWILNQIFSDTSSTPRAYT